MANVVKVLFIDDQPDFLDSTSFWMKSKGYDVATAESGFIGIDIIKQGGIDVVFLDFKMPEMDGIETLRRIREFNKTIPVILVTAHADDTLIFQLKGLNISGFFSKLGPFDELEQVLEVVLRNLQKTKNKENEPG